MAANATAPVLRDDWPALRAALPAHALTHALRSASESLAQGVLAAPVAAARWIAERAPALGVRPLLRLLILGAEKLDAVDAGRWYQAIPLLLGTAQEIEVTLVGQQLDAGFASPLARVAPARAAHCHAGTLAQFLAARSPPGFDLAFVFHPGFPKHQGWLRDSSLARLVGTGIPLVVASYEADEYEMDRWVVECHGFACAGAPLLNPLFLEFGAAARPVRWGRALWQFGVAVPAPGQRVDQERLSALDDLGRMVMHSMALNQAPLQSYGALVEGRTPDGSPLRLIYVFDEYFVHPTRGGVLAYRDGALESVAQIPDSALASYPGAAAGELARAVWAAGVKAKHLLPLCATPVRDTDQGTLARALHADLESKVEALFRQP